VLGYNNKLQTFPTVVLAGMFNFVKRDFFQADPADRQVPKVQF
jgi:LemA protein